jgi:predicted SAM-dependent methyltransferase
MKLDIGSDKHTKRGDDYTSVAIAGPAEVRASMWALPFKDNSIDSIWSSHALEHVGVYQVAPTLKEWHRVLKPKQKVIVSVPNFDYVAKYWLTGADRAWAEAMVFGTQSDEGQFHKCAFTAASLRSDLEAAGFKVKQIEMRWTHSQETLQAVAIKP